MSKFVVGIMREFLNFIIRSFKNLPPGFYGIDGMQYCIGYNVSVWTQAFCNFLDFLGSLVGAMIFSLDQKPVYRENVYRIG
jgi:hypothetical protein